MALYPAGDVGTLRHDGKTLGAGVVQTRAHQAAGETLAAVVGVHDGVIEDDFTRARAPVGGVGYAAVDRRLEPAGVRIMVNRRRCDGRSAGVIVHGLAPVIYWGGFRLAATAAPGELMRSRNRCKWLVAAAVVLSAGSALAHSEHDQARFVAPGGVDQGRCDSAARPCASIAYAAQNASKGDRILVAAGTYPIEDPADLFHVQSGLLDIRPGYSRYDHYLKADTQANPVVLTGVPPEFRESLNRRGFHVIADRKQLRGERLVETRAMLKAVDAMQIAKSNEPCSGGAAGGLACESVDLLAHVPLGDFADRPVAANDIWGFADLNTDREYVLIGLSNGVAVVDVTEPTAPVEVGSVRGDATTWRDIKVLQRYDSAAGRYLAYAYVTSDATDDQLQVVDLSGLPNTVALAAASPAIRFAHNVYMSDADFATGLAVDGGEPALHIAGSDLGGGAVRSFRLDDPLDPSLAATGTRGYTHDATSLSVDDARAAAQCGTAGPCRVLADFNESTVELWNMTALDAPVLLSSTAYANSAYTHSGWASEDGLHLFVHDELDEQQRGINTTVRVFSLADLTQPLEVGSYVGPSRATDHNGFARGNRYYMSNYTRGLVVLDISDPTDPVEAGFLDTFGPGDSAVLSGAWGAYPFLPSATIAVSDADSGLYLLRDRTLAAAAGTLSFTAAQAGAPEGGTAALAVQRLGGSAGAVGVDYTVVAASAGSGDFGSGLAGTLNWPAGDGGNRTIALDALADTDSGEPLERALIHLKNPTGGATLDTPATASIYLYEAGAVTELGFQTTDLTVPESGRQAVLTVQRRGSAAGPASVDFTVGGTAERGSDIDGPASGSLNWADGDASARSIVFAIIADSDDENDETVTVSLANAQGATLGSSTATVTISDDDTASGGPAPTPTGGGGGGAAGWAWLAALAAVAAVRWRRKGRAGRLSGRAPGRWK